MRTYIHVHLSANTVIEETMLRGRPLKEWAVTIRQNGGTELTFFFRNEAAALDIARILRFEIERLQADD